MANFYPGVGASLPYAAGPSSVYCRRRRPPRLIVVVRHVCALSFLYQCSTRRRLFSQYGDEVNYTNQDGTALARRRFHRRCPLSVVLMYVTSAVCLVFFRARRISLGVSRLLLSCSCLSIGHSRSVYAHVRRPCNVGVVGLRGRSVGLHSSCRRLFVFGRRTCGAAVVSERSIRLPVCVQHPTVNTDCSLMRCVNCGRILICTVTAHVSRSGARV